MDFRIADVRHPKEKLYGSIALVIGSFMWLIVALGAVLLLINGQWPLVVMVAFCAAAIWLTSYIASCLTRAYMIGHYVLIGPSQFPHLYQMVQECAEAAGLKEVPQTFVYNSSGVINAMALTLVGRQRYIWLTSALIDADSDEQVRFVIGHEIGHHIAGHLDEQWNLLRMPGLLVPFLGAAYSRGRELTCDRIGASLARNAQASRSALQMLACGSAKLNAQLNPNSFLLQEGMVPPVAGFFLHILSPYPRLTRRVAAVTDWCTASCPATNAAFIGRIEPRAA